MAVAEPSGEPQPSRVSTSAPEREAIPADAIAADALLRKGIELRKANDDRGALAAFTDAWKLAGSPEALAQMALAEQALGHWVEAHEHMREAVRHTEQPWIAEHQATLAAALQEMASRLGTVELSCNVDGAEVQLDGHVLGSTPLDGPLFLLAGRSVIQVSATGYFSVTREVHVDAGALSRLDVTLTAVEVEEASPVEGLPAAASVSPLPPPAADDGTARDYLFYGSLGLAALGLTIGVTGYVMREVNVRRYNDDARCDTELGTRRSEECPDEAARVQTGEAMLIGGFSAAAAFGALGLYLWLDTPDADSAGVACSVGVASFGCSGRF